VLDQNSKNINDKDLAIALDAFRRWVLTNSGAVSGFLTVAITNQPSGPPS
jgi:hypothetical protein